MARVKRGVTSHAKHKKVLKAVKGQWGRRKNTIRVAKQAMEKAMQYAYRDRRTKKREFKSDANFFLSSSANFPSCLNCELINPVLPNNSVLIWLTWFKSKFSLNFKRKSSFIFLILDILRDYFFTEEKQ